MTKRMKRFQIINSREFHGKYEVKDCKTGETYKFHNLASARVWAEAQNKEVEKEICEACSCVPCDCNWGN